MENLKHKACIALLYGSGLRVSELCRLRYQHIRRKDMRIFISASKNRSERYALLSEKALGILTAYWHRHGCPRGGLFPGQKKDRPICTVTVSRYIASHLQHLGWTNHVSAHTFRHSFAILYIHLARKGPAQARSPFDSEVR